MPIIGVPLKLGDTGDNVRALHNQLGTLNYFSIDPVEFNARRFGNTTLAALLDFRKRYGLPEVANNAPPFDASVDRLMNVVLAAVTGNNRTLRDAVRESFAADQNPLVQDIGWLATYAAIARDFTTARKVLALAPFDPEVHGKVAPVVSVSTFQPAQPDIQNPENYYTCRYDYVPQAVLNELVGRTAGSSGPRARLRLARRRPAPRDDNGDWPEVPDSVPDPEPPPADPNEDTRKAEIRDAAISWVNAVDLWQRGNREFKQQRYANAVTAYEACQDSIISGYFAKFYKFTTGLIKPSIEAFITRFVHQRNLHPKLWELLDRRRVALSLRELQALDWSGFSFKAESLIRKNLDTTSLTPEDNAEEAVTRQQSLDYFALLLGTIFIPLARAEANRLRRFSALAIADWERVVTPYQVFFGTPIFLTCDFIERPFALLALGETRMEKAEVQFKAASQGKAHEAQTTYQSIPDLFKDHGAYVTRVTKAQNALTDDADRLPQIPSDRKDIALQVFGKDVTVPGIESNTRELPGLSQTKAPAESWLRLKDTIDGDVIAETNPRIYALLLNAQARLLQIEHGFNYLGYKDDYIPPWRFQFLLERARYFAEHAKNAQRDYLNFLNNAEHEEFQEQSAQQAVQMEKSNVSIETARVSQVALDVLAANESANLAELTETNSQIRLDNYREFDQDMRFAENASMFGSFLSSVAGAAVTSIVNPTVGAGVLAAGIVGSVIQAGAEVGSANLQRDLELKNLKLSVEEAHQAKLVALAQLAVADAALVVAGLQRQAALLRHEFAIQNLQYLRNRTLNAEQWFRLANAIRGVADTYLRYAIELAFLAEQAYEFEADKRINAIRFDYDQSEVGAFLAGDFLLSDLDTIEQDFIVNQRQRQQQVRYVLSMTREFPAALEELREKGKVNFMLRLEQIEKRFPGLYNARVGMVDVLPVALMDSTRFSLDLTHTGSGQLRIKGQPDVRIGEQSESVFNVSDLPLANYDWTKTPKELWPVKVLVNEPETAVFSGLSRQDAASAFPVASSGQRNAFEGRALAGGWQIDMSARENQVVPGSLADLLITFTVSGYHDSGLRDAIDGAKPQTTTVTSFLCARQTFPDAFYDFSRTGKMSWKVPREMVASNGDLGRLRNIGMSLRPGVPDVHFSRLTTRLRMNFRVNESGGVASGVTAFTAIPETSVKQTAPLTVDVKAALNGASELAWDFGDGTPIFRTVRSDATPIAPAETTHRYAKPGRYVLKLRCVQNDALSEFRIGVVVSRDQILGDPLIVRPRFAPFDTTARTITINTGGAVQQAGRMLWRVGDLTAEGNTATFSLKPGHYTLDFAAVRKLNFLAYSAQRYIKESDPLQLQGFSAATNRTFDENGKETNGTGTPIPLPARNGLAKRLFAKGEISPEDDWTFELIPEEILGLPAGTNISAEELDLSEIQDVVLSMEYDITPGGP